MSYWYRPGIKRPHRLSSDSGGSVWPNGLTDLIITSDTALPLNFVGNYRDISITNNARVTMQDDGAGHGDGWLILGASRNFTLSGGAGIIIQGGSNFGGTFSKTAPDGTALSYTINIPPGGYGGNSNITINSSQYQGNGGGGGGLDQGQDGAAFSGGNGGQGGSSAQGGVGGAVYGHDGGVGNPDVTLFNDDAGSGGASVGVVGAGLYIKVAGLIIKDGTDYMTVSGGDGGLGGAGPLNPTVLHGGGGGGGGAGGCGGKIIIRKRIGQDFTTAQIFYANGFGTGGGPGGTGTAVNGGSGGSGVDGSSGILDYANY